MVFLAQGYYDAHFYIFSGDIACITPKGQKYSDESNYEIRLVRIRLRRKHEV